MDMLNVMRGILITHRFIFVCVEFLIWTCTDFSIVCLFFCGYARHSNGHYALLFECLITTNAIFALTARNRIGFCLKINQRFSI